MEIGTKILKIICQGSQITCTYILHVKSNYYITLITNLGVLYRLEYIVKYAIVAEICTVTLWAISYKITKDWTEAIVE